MQLSDAEKQELKGKLSRGAYSEIARKSKVKYQTVKAYFNSNAVSIDNEQKIVSSTLDYIEAKEKKNALIKKRLKTVLK